MNRVIKIGIGYDGEITFFHLRAITIAEENAFTAKFTETAGLAPEVKAEAETQACIDAIAAWSHKAPSREFADPDDPGKTKETVIYEDAVEPAEGVRRYFEEGDFDKERVANQLVLAYRTKLQPTVVFR